MTLSYARENKQCWNCNRPYDEVGYNPTAPNQIVGVCHECDSTHGLGYREKKEK